MSENTRKRKLRDFTRFTHSQYTGASISSEFDMSNVDLLEFTAKDLYVAPDKCRGIMGKEIHFNGSVKIRRKAFRNAKELKTLLFKGETKIDEYETFNSCRKLERVTFESEASVWEAFNNCSSLRQIVFKKFAYVRAAFMNCESLESVIFEEGAFIQKHSFSVCPNLKHIVLTGKYYMEPGVFPDNVEIHQTTLEPSRTK